MTKTDRQEEREIEGGREKERDRPHSKGVSISLLSLEQGQDTTPSHLPSTPQSASFHQGSLSLSPPPELSHSPQSSQHLQCHSHVNEAPKKRRVLSLHVEVVFNLFKCSSLKSSSSFHVSTPTVPKKQVHRYNPDVYKDVGWAQNHRSKK